MCHKCPQCVSHLRYCLLRLNNKANVSLFKTYEFVLLENKLQKGFQVLWTKLRISVIYQTLRRILLFKAENWALKEIFEWAIKMLVNILYRSKRITSPTSKYGIITQHGRYRVQQVFVYGFCSIPLICLHLRLFVIPTGSRNNIFY